MTIIEYNDWIQLICHKKQSNSVEPRSLEFGRSVDKEPLFVPSGRRGGRVRIETEKKYISAFRLKGT